MCDYVNCRNNAQLQMPYIEKSMNLTNEHHALMFCNAHHDLLKMAYNYYKYAEINIGNEILHLKNDGKFIIRQQDVKKQKEIAKNLFDAILWRTFFNHSLKFHSFAKLNLKIWMEHLESLAESLTTSRL